jgi:hypothetical protein
MVSVKVDDRVSVSRSEFDTSTIVEILHELGDRYNISAKSTQLAKRSFREARCVAIVLDYNAAAKSKPEPRA